MLIPHFVFLVPFDLLLRCELFAWFRLFVLFVLISHFMLFANLALFSFFVFIDHLVLVAQSAINSLQYLAHLILTLKHFSQHWLYSCSFSIRDPMMFESRTLFKTSCQFQQHRTCCRLVIIQCEFP